MKQEKIEKALQTLGELKQHLRDLGIYDCTGDLDEVFTILYKMRLEETEKEPS